MSAPAELIRAKAEEYLWRTLLPHYPREVFALAFELEDDVGERLRELRAEAEGFIEKLPWCEICGTWHPPVAKGQPLLLPKHDELLGRRVTRAHILFEFHRAGAGAVTRDDVVARLAGEIE